MSESTASWLLIIDNADDTELLSRLSEYFPSSYNGSILFTTRNHEVVVELGIPESNQIPAVEMERPEAIRLLETELEGEPDLRYGGIQQPCSISWLICH